MESKINKSVKQFFTPAIIPPAAGQYKNENRQARNFLCIQLGITMKQLRKRRILKDYILRSGVYMKAGVI